MARFAAGPDRRPVMVQPAECPKSPVTADQCALPCSLGDVATGASLIRTIQQCSRCGWVNPVVLDAWAEQAYKEQMDKQAQRIAMAASGEPFTFVRSSDQDIDVMEALGQALGAASMCWENPNAAGEFDATRAARIYEQLWKFLNEKMQPKPERIKPKPAVMCPDCGHQAHLHRDGALGPDRPEVTCIGKGPGYACPCNKSCEEINK